LDKRYFFSKAECSKKQFIGQTLFF